MKAIKLVFILYILSIIVMPKKLDSDKDDSDLIIEDEPKHKEKINQKNENKKQKIKQSIIDDMEEFDNPELLKKQEEQIRIEKEIKRNPKFKQNKEKENNIKQNTIKEPQKQSQNKIKEFIIKRLDFIFIGILIIFIINGILGVQVNKSIITNWAKENKKFVEDNYAHLGFEKDYNPKTTSLVMAESYNKYKFFASGRVYTNFLMIFFDLKKRQDLLSSLSSLFLFNEKDKISYHFSINPIDEFPMIFLICKKREIKSLKKQYEEISEFTNEINISGINKNNYCIYTENEEFMERLFKNNAIYDQYKKIEEYISMIFYSDLKSFSKNENALLLNFEFNKLKNDVSSYDITKFCHMLVDFICSSTLKASYKKDAQNKRKDYNLKKSKELAEKNAEEVKNKKEELKNNPKKPLTREQAIKLEEKERQDNLRKQKKKMYKIIKN